MNDSRPTIINSPNEDENTQLTSHQTIIDTPQPSRPTVIQKPEPDYDEEPQPDESRFYKFSWVLIAVIVAVIAIGLVFHYNLSKELANLRDDIAYTTEELENRKVDLEDARQQAEIQDKIAKQREAREMETTQEFNKLMNQLNGIIKKLRPKLESYYDDFDYDEVYKIYESGEKIVEKIKKFENKLTPEQLTEFDKARNELFNMANGVLFG